MRFVELDEQIASLAREYGIREVIGSLARFAHYNGYRRAFTALNATLRLIHR